ncbi:TPA: hypothetical protein ACXLPC_004571 [Salmonella enterica]
MTLEQRVEALEKTVKVLAGRDFAVDEGRVFINEAFIQEVATKAARKQAAICFYMLSLGIKPDVTPSGY